MQLQGLALSYFVTKYHTISFTFSNLEGYSPMEEMQKLFEM
jgi:hypothetical protein